MNGHTKSILDQKRINAEAGYIFAKANNGGKLNSYLKALDVQESKIGKTDKELEQDKAYKKAVHERQRADMSQWYKAVNGSNNTEKEESDE